MRCGKRVAPVANIVIDAVACARGPNAVRNKGSYDRHVRSFHVASFAELGVAANQRAELDEHR